MRTWAVLIGVVLGALLASTPAHAVTNVQIPGLQVALKSHGVYAGPIDGVSGPQTARAIRAFQKRAGLTVDGIAGKQTRRALGRLGRPLFGSRLIRRGMVGWDVSVLQFLLARKGLLNCAVDGRFGPLTERALRLYQRRQELAVDGIAGPATLAALDPSGVRPPLRRPKPKPKRKPKVRYVAYVVERGDTLTDIAATRLTTVPTLARLNGLDPAGILFAGATLRVPFVQPEPESREWVRRRLGYWARRYHLDPSLVRAVAWMESGFQAHLVSSTGDFGVMQVSEPTWEFVESMIVGEPIPRTVDANIRVGTLYLRHVLRFFGGDVRRGVGAYHEGPYGVQKDGLSKITEKYVEAVLALRERM